MLQIRGWVDAWAPPQACATWRTVRSILLVMRQKEKPEELMAPRALPSTPITCSSFPYTVRSLPAAAT